MIDDLTRDPREADVAQAQRLLDAADQSGLAVLPSLLAVDLCVFGAYRQAMFDEAALQTWAALTGPAREQFGGDSLAGLTRRGLLGREAPRNYGPEPAVRYRMHPALALILAARARPVWLAVCSVASTAFTGPRMYGVGTYLEPLRAAVVELPREPAPAEPTSPDLADLGKVYDYVLAGTAKAADLLAGWAMFPAPGGGGATRPLRRAVDVYHHQEGRPLSRVRTLVEGDEQPARVSVGERGAAQVLGDYDQSALADHLQKVIRRYT